MMHNKSNDKEFALFVVFLPNSIFKLHTICSPVKFQIKQTLKRQHG